MAQALQGIPDVSVFDRAWRFLVDQLIQDVPESIAVCEFDCREPQCSGERWHSCERRLQAQQRAPEKPTLAA